ncbi:MAG: TSUP family transporter [Candidatus Hydrogenedentes bacterium]|nr:TSUP family transporter [Candidatus Hydrogenedentota bacterium]
MIPFIVGFCAICVGGCIQGCIGFAFAMVVVPPMMMVMEPEVVVPIIMIMSILNTSWVAVQSRRDVIPGLVAPLLFGGVLGVPLGLYNLTWP